MATNVKQIEIHDVLEEITHDVAWKGMVSGLQAEALLKGQKPFVYLLRAGERDSNFYVSFVGADYSLRHQPFEIVITPEGWYCINGAIGGPYGNMMFSEAIHTIMHCLPTECSPLRMG